MIEDDPAQGSWSLADWIVLGLLVERPRHGFSLVKELTPDTLLGQVWSLPNPVIYRALHALQAKAMITPEPAESSSLGPRRVPMQPTRQGRERLLEWLGTPLDHLRDMRVLLRVKLHLTLRLGLDPIPLLVAQRARNLQAKATVSHSPPPGTRVEQDLLRIWREEQSIATNRFVDRAIDLFGGEGRR
ncbi:hypothetical protein GCM10023322_48620 [Rugosimonospora acidiphila]|uniref:Transcription regulator PadR N-terminal domain-containing protein n=1 Tax=Rugosimonospora acidiphila TaxID=556531 RepID=A0ABP9S638_9ACTN